MIRPKFIADYIRHRISATVNSHKKSLFVHRLTKDIIRDFATKPVYPEVEQLRRHLLKDKRRIPVKDLGAGSHAGNGTTKKVSRMARHNLKPAKLAQLLYRLAEAFNPDTLVELGTCFGITTVYLAKAIPKGKVITIEGCPATAGMARETFRRAMISNVMLRNDNFDTALPGVFRENKADFVFIDGNHRKEATLSYFRLYLQQAHENSVMVFDDIYWSQGMKEAWAEIRNHEHVTVTIDLFWIGIVFFIKDHPKQNFFIRL